MTRYLVWSLDLGIDQTDALQIEDCDPAIVAENFVKDRDDGSFERVSTVRVYVADGDYVRTFDVSIVRDVTYSATEVQP